MNHWFSSLVTFGLLLPVAAAQEPPGRFTNLETPQTHPIDIATVSGVDYVLVCNTPDNSVEIYAAAWPHTFVSRVPVGLGPVTVRWHELTGRFFTCNFDGDSVSVVRISGASASPSNPQIELTTPVGDEPSDVALDPLTGSYEDPEQNLVYQVYPFVTLSSSSRFARFELQLPAAGGALRNPLSDTIGVLEAEFEDATEPDPELLAVKMPRAALFTPAAFTHEVFVANLRGGSPATSTEYDVAIYRFNPPSTSTATILGGLGTTHHALAMRSDGGRMFVVGTKAKNNSTDSQGLDEVSSRTLHPTGFVESWMWVVDVSSSSMTLRSEQSASSPVLFSSVNLNRDYTQTTHTPVATEDALVQPTDVLLIEDTSGGVEKIVIAAFHSDRVAILTPNASTNHYDVERVDIPVRSTGSYSIAGPRGLAYSADTELLYTNGRLDNSLHVIDPDTLAVTSIALQNDPTPAVVREGREFLYSNRFSIDDSGSTDVGGFVSCAACHVDGRTDGLAWDLGEPEDGPEIEPEFRDGLTVEQEEFQEEKGRMMTQTLQGLINFHPLNEEAQFVSTNAPYYWRGARRGAQGAGPFDELNESFDSFAEAFALLQGMDEPLSSGDIEKFRHFVNTIMYPPNPEQDPARETTGTLGEDPNDPEAEEAEGALFGMMLFHNVPAITVDPAGNVLNDDLLPRSCVDCHSLPDGSNSLATVVFPGVNLAATFEVGLETFETAGLRNISQREMWLHDDFGAVPTHIVGNTALLHAGTPLFDDTPGGGLPTNHVTNGAQSINKFNVSFFESEMPGPDTSAQIEAVTAFMRQLDTGLAPAVGRAYTVDPYDATANAAEFDLLEEQVEEGNIGLAVYTRNNGTVQGYWYDITASTPGYRAEGSTSTPISRSTLLALAADPDDIVIAQATPLGGERRWASDDGTATLIQGLTFAEDEGLVLLPMVTNTAYVDVHRFTDNLNEDVLTSTDPEMAKTSLWALRTLQTRVAGNFGVPSSLRHEPPRRFRVVGSSIRPGAKLILTMIETQASGSDTLDLEMDIYPVLSSTEGLVWETFVELDALHTFALLNGGYLNQDVVDIIQRDQPTSWASGYLSWNRFEVRLVNEDSGSSFNPNLQTLSIQDGR